MTVILNEAQISDLFLDQDKLNLDAAYAALEDRADALDKALLRDPASPLHAALLEDAKYFSAITGVPADWLVDDFIERV